MEKMRPTRSKVSSGSERRSSSGERFASRERASARGNRQVLKLKNFPNLVPEFSSCSSGSTGEDPLTFESGWRSSKQAVGAPIKNLLAEEMLRETESRRRSPSVIAKLMGLDGMPPQQPTAHKQQKSIPENRFQRARSVEKEHRSGVRCEHRSSKKNSKEQQEFKDVFEVLESSKVESCSYSTRAASNYKLSDAEMAFVQQKFMDAKRLSTDEKLQDSKEFDDALDVLDSNKDLLLKFLQRPDSLFTKHLHDLRTGPQSHCGRVASMKSSQVQKYEKIDLGLTSAREAPLRNYCKSPQRHRDSFSSYSDSRHPTRYSLKSSQYQSAPKYEPTSTPTRIVVLKPNIGKVLNAAKTISSPCSSQASMSVCMNHTELTSTGNMEKKSFQDNEGHSRHSRHKSRESREVAKEITRQMKSNFSMGGPVNFSSSGFKGYAGDESSCSMSENESGNESEIMSMASKHSFDVHNHSRRSSSCSTESSVSREAKKRLSERWKLTHSQEGGAASRGSTLADMLAIPDKEMKAAKLDAMKGEAEIKNKFAREDRHVGWDGPLGISSRDGWKDGYITTLSRSKSLPSSSSSLRSYKTSRRREMIRDDRYLIPVEAFRTERNQSVKVDLDHREGPCRSSRSRHKRSYTSRTLSRESIEISFETPTTQHTDKTFLEENQQSQQEMAVFESSSSNGLDSNPASVKLVELDVSMSSETPDAFPPEFSACMLMEGDSCCSPQDNRILKEPSTRPSNEKSVPSEHSVPGIESLASKEAEQPSPVSVLEVPFTDDASSTSDCFETLSADLQGLRMQLQLLKLESDSYAEGSMLFLSDDNTGKESTRFRSALRREEECWKSSYMIVILAESGLSTADHETFLAAWHTPECPVSPLLFEELESKYCDDTSSKSERKLLFDQINSGLVEMFLQFTDPHPWVRPVKIQSGPQWINKNALQDGLFKLLTSEENANEESLDKLLERDSLWLHFGDDIDMIGREVERSLLDELVAEVVVM